MSTKSLIKSFEKGKPLNRNQKHVLIVYAHQEPKSFNGALLKTAVESLEREGHSVEVSDLYSMHFEPRAQKSDIVGEFENANIFKYQIETKVAYEKDKIPDDIRAEIGKLKRADLVIFQFPLYWFSVPAILKGWFDRVFIMGFAFGMGNMYQKGGLKGKKALLSFTTGGPSNMYSPTGINGDINIILWPLQNGCLNFTGFEVLEPQVTWAAAHLDDSQRKDVLQKWSNRMKNIIDEKPLKFIHCDNFNGDLKKEILENEDKETVALTIGQHNGKVLPIDSMLKAST